MLKVDLHTHIIPRDLPDFGKKFAARGFITLKHCAHNKAHMLKDDGKMFREISHNCWDPVVRIQECDAHGIDVQVLSTIPVLMHYGASDDHALDTSRYFNDHLAETISRYPTRFKGLATVPLQNPDLAARELERAVNDLGLSGVQIGTHVGPKNLDDPGIVSFLRAAQDLDTAVFVHPWDMLGADRMPRYMLPWLVGMPTETALAIATMIFGGVFEQLKTLRIAFAHGGGAVPAIWGRLESGFHARPDLCAQTNPYPPSRYLGRFWVDSLTHDPEALKHIISLFGINRVALGTDYPFPLGELNPPGAVIEKLHSLSPLTHDDLAKLYGKNALEWLGLSSA